MNALRPDKLQIVILAAGFSSRLGKPKALATINGQSLLRRTLMASAPLSRKKILIIVPPQQGAYRREASGFNVRIAVNRRRADGLSSSVRLALGRARDAGAVMLLPVDLARLKSRELTRLASRWCARPRAIVARKISGRAGIPLIIPHWLFGLAAAAKGDAGLRNVLAPKRYATVLVDMPSAEMDVDLPHDLQNARRCRGGRAVPSMAPVRIIRKRR